MSASVDLRSHLASPLCGMGGAERDQGKLGQNEPPAVVVPHLDDRRGGAPGRAGLGASGHEKTDDHGDHEQEEMPGGHDAPGYQGAHGDAWQALAHEVEQGAGAT